MAQPHAPPSFPTRRSSDLLVPLEAPSRTFSSEKPLPSFLTEPEEDEEPALGEKEESALPREDKGPTAVKVPGGEPLLPLADRKSTRLNSSHVAISYAVFCL